MLAMQQYSSPAIYRQIEALIKPALVSESVV
ncbi:hypothetical protein J2Z75_001387 [Rhizobium herbae]|uniref:GntR family transcriptional regulator n=1 Tax=Rhizobium herbae TaxID=508661 RepID=A0ABS4EIX5_9HYPH|nr:hypothetical protein [Rhizobium herbae]